MATPIADNSDGWALPLDVERRRHPERFCSSCRAAWRFHGFTGNQCREKPPGFVAEGELIGAHEGESIGTCEAQGNLAKTIDTFCLTCGALWSRHQFSTNCSRVRPV
jgi:hypothetical protein